MFTAPRITAISCAVISTLCARRMGVMTIARRLSQIVLLNHQGFLGIFSHPSLRDDLLQDDRDVSA